MIGLHETESAGLLEKIDWQDLARRIRGYSPDELDEIFLEEVDELAYSSFLALKLDWSIVKAQTLKILDYLILREKLPVELSGRRIYIPKPSRSLKLASITGTALILRDDLKSGLYGIAVYDGEETEVSIGVIELGHPDQSYTKIMMKLSNLIDQGFRIIVYDYSTLSSTIELAGATSLKAVLDGLASMNKIIDAHSVLAKIFGKDLSMELVEEALGLEKDVKLQDLIYLAEEERRRIPHMRIIKGIPKRLAERLEEFLRSEAENLYKAYLIAEELSKGG